MHKFGTLLALATVSACGLVGVGIGPVSASNSHTHQGTHGLVTQVFSTAQSRFDQHVLNQGWWSDRNIQDKHNDNYIVGACCGKDQHYRDFFTFDLSELRAHVVSAQLRVNTGLIRGQGVHTLGLFDVSTPAEIVNTSREKSPEIFNDLGTGTSYGTFEFTRSQAGDWVNLSLNRSAIKDMNDSRGDYFTVGGRLLSLIEGKGKNFVFGASQETVTRLVLRTTPTPHR